MPPSDSTYRRAAGVTGLLASVACGGQLLWLVMWGVWGAPPNPLHWIALFGAVTLLIGSIVLLSTAARKAATVSLISTLPLWVFYLPATVSTLSLALNGAARFQLLPLLPPMVLIGCTAFAALAIRRHNHPSQWAGAEGRGFEVQEVPGRGRGR